MVLDTFLVEKNTQYEYPQQRLFLKDVFRSTKSVSKTIYRDIILRKKCDIFLSIFWYWFKKVQNSSIGGQE